MRQAAAMAQTCEPHLSEVVVAQSSDEMSASRVLKYSINTVSRAPVHVVVEGGFTQANHGRSTTLWQLARSDLLAFYKVSLSNTSVPLNGEELRMFALTPARLPAAGRLLGDARRRALAALRDRRG